MSPVLVTDTAPPRPDATAWMPVPPKMPSATMSPLFSTDTTAPSPLLPALMPMATWVP